MSPVDSIRSHRAPRLDAPTVFVRGTRVARAAIWIALCLTIGCDVAPPTKSQFEPVQSVGSATPLQFDLRSGEEVEHWARRNDILQAEHTDSGLRLTTTGDDPYISRPLEAPYRALERVTLETVEAVSGPFRIYLRIGGSERELFAADTRSTGKPTRRHVADFGDRSWRYGSVAEVRIDFPALDAPVTIASLSIDPLPPHGRHQLDDEGRVCARGVAARVSATALAPGRVLVPLGIGPDALAHGAQAELILTGADAEGTRVHSSRHRMRLAKPGWQSVLVDLEKGSPSPVEFEMTLRPVRGGAALPACFGQPAPLPEAGGTETPPNVLLLSIDTFRADRLKHAPFLRRLAAEGRLFTHAWSSSNWTLPSHVSLFTSTPVIEHGTPRAGRQSPFPGTRIPARLPVLAEIMKDAGYVTGAATGGGFAGPNYDLSRGFDRFSFVSSPEAPEFEHHEAFARDFVSRAMGRPFFLFVHTFKVHDYFRNTPDYHDFVDADSEGEQIRHGSYLDAIREGSAPPDYVSRLYDSGVRRADEFAEHLVEEIRVLTNDAPLLVVVVSDHGESFGEHDGVWHHGTSMNEEQIRIPLIAWGNFAGAPIGEAHDPTSTIDVAPSILAVSGLPVPEGFRGERDRFSARPRSARVFPLLSGTPMTGREVARSRLTRAIIEWPWKYTRSDSFAGETMEERCRHLESDPSETGEAREAALPTECVAFPGRYARLIEDLSPGNLLLVGKASARFEVEGDGAPRITAILSGRGASSAVANLEEGLVDWHPSEEDALAVFLESKPTGLYSVEVGGAVAADEIALDAIGSPADPTLLRAGDDAAGDGVRLFVRDLPPEPASGADRPLRPELVEQLKALGYSVDGEAGE